MSIAPPTLDVKGMYFRACSESANRHLHIGRQLKWHPLWPPWEWGGVGTFWGQQKSLENWRVRLIFQVGKKGNGAPWRQGRHPERLPDPARDTHGGDQLVFGESAKNP